VIETQGRQRFASFDALVEGIAVVSESGQVLFWNRWLEGFSGVSRIDALARPLAECLPQLAPSLAEPIARALRGESNPPQRAELARASGAAALTALQPSALRLCVEPLDAYDVLRCAIVSVQDLGDWVAAQPERLAGSAEQERELVALRARVAAQDAQLRRQTELLLRHAREVSEASAAVEEVLARCERERPVALAKSGAAGEAEAAAAAPRVASDPPSEAPPPWSNAF